MSFDRMIEVLTAAKHGMPIEHRDAFNDWRLCNPSVPDGFMFYGDHEYRVKPEPRKPREWFVVIDGNGFQQLFTDNQQLVKGAKIIRVREVIEE